MIDERPPYSTLYYPKKDQLRFYVAGDFMFFTNTEGCESMVGKPRIMYYPEDQLGIQKYVYNYISKNVKNDQKKDICIMIKQFIEAETLPTHNELLAPKAFNMLKNS